MGKRNRERVARIRAGLEAPRVPPPAERRKQQEEAKKMAQKEILRALSLRRPLPKKGEG